MKMGEFIDKTTTIKNRTLLLKLAGFSGLNFKGSQEI